YPIIGVNIDVAFAGPGARILSDTRGNREPITPGGPADRAGVQPGDVIVEVDGEPVLTYEEFVVALRSRAPGDVVTLSIKRGTESLSVDVTLGSTTG
ncbi:MAG TPA: PDZ domain-containing protein, partial [Actinomycetes bacterium]|nr:PDZ domain-containing protein [Actinomycetes bacterium]